MKAVIWHAEGPKLWNAPEGTYKSLFNGFVKNVHPYGIEVIHLTSPGHEVWGDIGIEYPLNPKHVMLAREQAFTRFLREKEDDVYWFTEPDIRIVKPIPELSTDACFLYRPNDGVAITPSFRLVRKAALPIFEYVLEQMNGKRKDWHGDSEAFASLHKAMGSPAEETINFLGCSVELRKYKDYNTIDGRYMSHHKFTSKLQLV